MTYQDIARRNRRLYAALERAHQPELIQLIKYELEGNLDRLDVMLKRSPVEPAKRKQKRRYPVRDTHTGVEYNSIYQASIGTGTSTAALWYKLNKGKDTRFEFINQINKK